MVTILPFVLSPCHPVTLSPCHQGSRGVVNYNIEGLCSVQLPCHRMRT